jgi:FkbM family methyltransferase
LASSGDDGRPRGRRSPRLWRFLASHTDGRFVRSARRLAESAVALLHAENHNPLSNGEAYLLDRLGGQAAVIFDVGANRGDWTAIARQRCPRAQVHCFELVGETRARLGERYRVDPHVHVASYGLAEAASTVRVKHYPEHDPWSSLYDYPHPAVAVWRDEPVESGDRYVEREGIGAIDLLKTDVEGADLRVLRGFRATLAAGRVSVIQFEYGYAAILSRALLIDFYEYLEPLGFRIGKLHRHGVRFRPYSLFDENFFGPNFVAVQASRSALLEQLAERRA